MEARVAKLEATTEHIRGDVSAIRTDMRSLKESTSNARERLAALEVKVDHLPGKGFIVTG